MSDKRVMVIGSGGRECAFAWKLNKDNEDYFEEDEDIFEI